MTRGGDIDCDVLIVGLGPVGGLLANLLGRAGRSVVVIDEAPAVYALPRAAVIDDEVLRILQAVGLDQEVLRDAQIQRRVTFVTAKGEGLDIMRPADGPFGQPPLVSIHQPSLERALQHGLERFEHVHVRRSVRLESLDPAADHVDAWVRATDDGTRSMVRARFLVGCDGARSGVRARIGASFDGSTFAQRWIVLDALVDRPLPTVAHPHFYGRPERPVVSLPMSPGRHRWEFMLQPGEDEAPLMAPAALRALIAPWTAGVRADVERAVVYAFHARIASSWRAGRILLAGDAAHVMPPFVGQGFSSGARDAANLAWKLDAVLRGAPGALLDTYERERRAHVRQMQALAVRWGALLQTTDPRHARLRDRVMPVMERTGVLGWLRENAKPRPTYASGAFARRPHRLPFRRSVGALFPQPDVRTTEGPVPFDTVLGGGWALVAGDADAARVAAPLGARTVVVGVDFEDPEGTVADWLAAHGSRWALLRPDRYVFATGEGSADVAACLPALGRVGAVSPVPASITHRSRLRAASARRSTRS